MRAVIQRVSHASVVIDGQTKASIGQGLMILLGVEHEDSVVDSEWLAAKIRKMRIFGDSLGAMNLSVEDVVGEVLIISQFTLHGSTHKGNRPSFIRAARPETARPLYEDFIARFERAQSGTFGADMKVTLCNDGPVTIIIDSKDRQ